MNLGVNDKGQTTVPSRFGALCTVLLYFLLAAYASYKIVRLVEKKNYNLMQSTDHSGVHMTKRLTAEQGFKLAFTIENYIEGEVIPPEVGSISANILEYGMASNYYSYYKPIESHPCS